MKSILVDSSVMHHAAIGASKWESTGKVFWGGLHEVDTGFLRTDVTIPHVAKAKGGPHAHAIGRLAQLFRDCEHRAFQSDALSFERIGHSIEKFSGKGYAGGTLMEGVDFENIATLEGFSFSFDTVSVARHLRNYLEGCEQESYKKIWRALKDVKVTDRSSQDAWHLYTAINWKMDYFVTADTKLLGQIRSIKDKKLRGRLTTIALSPAALCKSLKVEPMTDEELAEQIKGFWDF